MSMQLEKSRELTARFNNLLPGGHSNMRVPGVPGGARIFQARAQGARFWDVDGNEFIDYMAGKGPNILGHRHPEYVASLQAYMDTMSVCTGSGLVLSEDDIEVAQKLVQYIPCAEQVKFCVTGGDAVQMAFRLARAHTGRPYFLRFGGHYHGWPDNVLGGVPDQNPAGKPYAIQNTEGDGCATAGKFPGANQEGLMIPWNDVEALESTIKRFGEEIAIIHFEPFASSSLGRHPLPGYLEKIRTLCDDYNIVMCMDEIVTGIRSGLGGAQALFGVIPDLCTLGKALGGGMPISAVVGKHEIMTQLESATVLGPGTFNGQPLSMHAAKTTLNILERDEGALHKLMEKYQSVLMQGFKEIAHRRGIPLKIRSILGEFHLLFGVSPETDDYAAPVDAGVDFEMMVNVWRNLLEEGVYSFGSGGRWFPSIAHNDKDIEDTLQAFDNALATL